MGKFARKSQAASPLLKASTVPLLCLGNTGVLGNISLFIRNILLMFSLTFQNYLLLPFL